MVLNAEACLLSTAAVKMLELFVIGVYPVRYIKEFIYLQVQNMISSRLGCWKIKMDAWNFGGGAVRFAGKAVMDSSTSLHVQPVICVEASQSNSCAMVTSGSSRIFLPPHVPSSDVAGNGCHRISLCRTLRASAPLFLPVPHAAMARCHFSISAALAEGMGR